MLVSGWGFGGDLSKMRIMIADDHALFRGGLKLQLAELVPEAEFLETASFDELLDRAPHEPPADLSILDLTMPGPHWRDALGQLRGHWPATRMVILSGDDAPATVHEAISLGVNGFIPKTEQPHVFTAALRLILSGGTYVPLSALGHAPQPGAEKRALLPITDRQKQVLELMAEGCANKEIAYRLGLTEGTVKLHVAAVLRSLGAHNRTQAVNTARSNGLLPR